MKIVIKNSTIAIRFLYSKTEKAKCFFLKYEYHKQATAIGSLEINITKSIGFNDNHKDYMKIIRIPIKS